MKNLNRLLILSISFLLFVACSTGNDQNPDNTPYYEFNTEDASLIINYNYVVDQIITYKNEDGEALRFKVLENETQKREYRSGGTFSGGGGLLENYYDSKVIRFEILENPSSEEYAIVNYVFSKNKDVFTNGINVPMWNITLFSFIDEFQNSINIPLRDFNPLPKNSVTINDHQFNKVITIKSKSEESNNSSIFGPLPQNVNEILYDFDFGVIQFKETNGTIWNVVYPE